MENKNREIKFRAWDKKERKIISDALLIGNIGLGEGSVLADSETQKGNELIWQQFTGLKDKNGKEIYEGDIVIYGNDKGVPKKQYTIKWKDGMFIADYKPKENNDYENSFVDSIDNKYDLRTFCAFNSSLIEIVGNIFENKDLLN
jgi:uncharacterized phage protein (TIGR01671 family)